MIQEFINIIIIDILHNFYNNIINYNCNNITRWFFLHSIINFIISYYALSDVITCTINNNICYKINWNFNSVKVYNYSTLLHLYHCIFFNLTKDDYFHHILMVCICGTLCYLIKSIISSFALFFLTGLPGAIDYMLLYLVKKNKIKSISEKKIYTYLSAYLRAPGCTYALSLGMNGVINYYNEKKYNELLILLITIIIVFWNGQFYNLKSYESYLKKNKYFT